MCHAFSPIRNARNSEIESEPRITETERTPTGKLPILNRATWRDLAGIELKPLRITNSKSTLNSERLIDDRMSEIVGAFSFFFSLFFFFSFFFFFF